MPRNRMLAFRLDEISAVDNPAQVHAKAIIMKRAPLMKQVWMTDAVNGHQHLVEDSGWEGQRIDGGSTSYARAEGEDQDHTHPWVRNADGTITVGESEGHSHALTGGPQYWSKAAKPTATTKEGETMTDEEKKKLEEAQAAAEEAKKALAIKSAEADMTDAQKAYYKTLDAAGKAAFVKMTPADRATKSDEFAKAQADTNPVVYTATDGTTYRKSDDPRLAVLAKDRDTDRKERAEALEKAENADFTKQAETTLKHLPGDVATVKVPLLKSIAKLSDEAKTGILALLKAGEDAIAKGFTTFGTSRGGDLDVSKGTDGEIDVGAREYHKTAPAGQSFAKSYDLYLKTEKGRELYAKKIAAAPRAAA